MQTNHLVFDDCSQRQLAKNFVDQAKDGFVRGEIFSEPRGALVGEPEVRIDRRVFVVAPQQVHLVWLLHLQGHQQTNRLQGMRAPVHKISKKQLIETLDVSIIGRVVWTPLQIEEPH